MKFEIMNKINKIFIKFSIFIFKSIKEFIIFDKLIRINKLLNRQKIKMNVFKKINNFDLKFIKY